MFDLIRLMALDEGGSTAIEYGFVAALISIAAMAAYTELGSSLDSIFRYVDGLIVVANGS
jgi:pilus assembly protein Flp/PilA